ncbi:hypothetical protein ABPG72_007090 [Tetrahymena utriculariae]
MEKKSNETFQQCSTSYSNIIYVDDKDVKNCVTTCSLYLSADQKLCQKSCPPNEFVNDKVDAQAYIQCQNSYPQRTYQYTNDNNIKQCIKQCNFYLSSNKQICQSSCLSDYVLDKKPDSTFFECSPDCSLISFIDSGVKKCTNTCSYYLSPRKKEYKQQCESNQFINQKVGDSTNPQCSTECPQQAYQYVDENNKKHCINGCTFFLSSDKLKCQNQCLAPEFVMEKELAQSYIQCSTTCYKFQYTY